MRRLFGILALLALSACVGPEERPIPPGYNGPLARVFDSITPRSSTSVDIFYLAEVNGRAIPNSLSATRAANHGLGFTQAPVLINRQLPAQPSVFKIVGRTEYAGAVQAIVNKVYEITGQTTFTPLPDRVYQVKGEFRPERSSIWIWDTATYQVMGQKIEIEGSATLELPDKAR
jgi:hypothetical protein